MGPRMRIVLGLALVAIWIGCSGSPSHESKAAAPESSVADELGGSQPVYSYTDARGETHIVVGLDNVPPEKRSTAQEVGSVQTKTASAKKTDVAQDRGFLLSLWDQVRRKINFGWGAPPAETPFDPALWDRNGKPWYDWCRKAAKANTAINSYETKRKAAQETSASREPSGPTMKREKDGSVTNYGFSNSKSNEASHRANLAEKAATEGRQRKVLELAKIRKEMSEAGKPPEWAYYGHCDASYSRRPYRKAPEGK